MNSAMNAVAAERIGSMAGASHVTAGADKIVSRFVLRRVC
jgi:hypothetical protein